MDSRIVSAPTLPSLADGEFAFYRSVAKLAGVGDFNLEFLRIILERVDVGDYALSTISDEIWFLADLDTHGKVIRALKEHGESYSVEKFVMTMKMAALKEAANNESNCR